MFAMPSAVSLRSNFVWTFAGNAVYAAGQWALLSLLAKLGGGEMLGQYALALAVTAPVVMLSHLNLRAVIATDVTGRHPFGDYLAVRLGATALGLAAIACARRGRETDGPIALVILAVGIAQSAENVSDAFYGALQRHERMDRIARSMMGRAALSALALGGALWLTGSIVAATAALAAARIASLLLFDVRTGEALVRTTPRAAVRDPAHGPAPRPGADAGDAQHEPAALCHRAEARHSRTGRFRGGSQLSHRRQYRGQRPRAVGHPATGTLLRRGRPARVPTPVHAPGRCSRRDSALRESPVLSCWEVRFCASSTGPNSGNTRDCWPR